MKIVIQLAQNGWTGLDATRPVILGGMFDALAGAMRIYPDVELDRLHRMADFCRWGYAVAEALGVGGHTFLEAYRANIGRANEEAITANPVASAVVAFMAGRHEWTGTVAELLGMLDEAAVREKINTRSRSWPRAANALTRRLKQVTGNLADAGIEYEERRTRIGAVLALRQVRKNTVTIVTSSPTQQQRGFPGDDTGDDIAARENTVTIPSPQKPSNGAAGDGGDGNDDILPAPSDTGYEAFSRAVDEVRQAWAARNRDTIRRAQVKMRE